MPRKHVSPEKQPNADAEVRLVEIPEQTETGMCGRCITFGADDSRPGRILDCRPVPERPGLKAIGYKPVAELRRSRYQPVRSQPPKPLDMERGLIALEGKDPLAMVVPNNEGKVCDAVVRALEKTSRETRADVRYPEKDGVGPPVDLRLKPGDQDYAIEHTRIESFENQIGTVVVANRMLRHIKKNIPNPFPSPAYYELQFPINVALSKGKARSERALNALVEWVRAKEQILRKRNSTRFPPVHTPHMANDAIRGAPPEFECEFELAALAGRAAHGCETGHAWFPVHPARRSRRPASGQAAAGFRGQVPEAGSLQGGRRTHRSGFGDQ